MVKQQASSAKRWQRAKNPQTQQGQEGEHQESKVHQGDRVVRLEEPDANKYKVRRRRPTIMMPKTKVQSPEISLWLKQNDFLSLLQGFLYNAMMTPPHKSRFQTLFSAYSLNSDDIMGVTVRDSNKQNCPAQFKLESWWSKTLPTTVLSLIHPINRIANHNSDLNAGDQHNWKQHISKW